MKSVETKKNINEMQNKEEYVINNFEQDNYQNKRSRKPLLLDKSDYGWDGDY